MEDLTTMVVKMARVLQCVGVEVREICHPRHFDHSGSFDMLLNMGPMYAPCPPTIASKTDLNCYDYET